MTIPSINLETFQNLLNIMDKYNFIKLDHITDSVTVNSKFSNIVQSHIRTGFVTAKKNPIYEGVKSAIKSYNPSLSDLHIFFIGEGIIVLLLGQYPEIKQLIDKETNIFVKYIGDNYTDVKNRDDVMTEIMRIEQEK